MEKAVRIYFPRWISLFYLFCALVLIPWIILLAELLPTRHLARNWDALWVGFDILIFISIVLTIYFIIRRKIWVIISATALSTLLLVDIWFDVLTAKPGHQQVQAILSGMVELILAVLTFRLIFHVLHKTTPEKNFRVVIQNQKNLS